MRKLLIAEPSEEFTAALINWLCDEFDIRTCRDGETALELLQSFQPELLLLNLMLPFKDGLTLLEETPYKPPVVLGLTTFCNSYTERRAMELGMKQLLITPSPRTVSLRLLDLAYMDDDPANPKDRYRQAAELLRSLSYGRQPAAFRQLCTAIVLYKDDPNISLSKELYPAVTAACGCTSDDSVEAALRRAIRALWKYRYAIVWQKYFPNSTKCPSNKKFLSRLAEELE